MIGMMNGKKRGRPAKQVPETTDEAIRLVKAVVKEYKQLKEFCSFIPRRRRSMFQVLNIHTEGYEESGCISYNQELVDRIPQGDRDVVLNYEKAMKKVWILEHGIASIPDGRTKAIANDTLIDGIPVLRLLQKYGIGKTQLFWEKDRAIKYVAQFLSKCHCE